MDGIHCTKTKELHAIWRLRQQQIAIMRLQTPDDEIVVSFEPGPYPDLAEARERFPRLTRLWDAVRHQYWAQLAPPLRFPRDAT